MHDHKLDSHPTYQSLQTIVISQLSEMFRGLVFRDRLPVRDSHVSSVEFPVVVRLVSDKILDEACGLSTRKAIFNISAYDRKDCIEVDFVAGYAKALVCLIRQLVNVDIDDKRILDVREVRTYPLPQSSEYYGINAVVSILYTESNCDVIQACFPDFVPAPPTTPYDLEEELDEDCGTTVGGQGMLYAEPAVIRKYVPKEEPTPVCVTKIGGQHRVQPEPTTKRKHAPNDEPPTDVCK